MVRSSRGHGSLVLVLFILVCLTSIADGGNVFARTQIVVDGIPLELEERLLVEEGAILVPLVPFVDALGAMMQVHEDEATIVMGSRTWIVRLAQLETTIDDKTYIMPVKAQLVQGAWYVPLSVWSDLFHVNLRWDPVTKVLFLQQLPEANRTGAPDKDRISPVTTVPPTDITDRPAGESVPQGLPEPVVPLAGEIVQGPLAFEVQGSVVRIIVPGPVEARVSVFQEPERVVIDLPFFNATVLPEPILSTDDPLLRTARAGRFTPTDARVVLDLWEPAVFQLTETTLPDGRFVLEIRLVEALKQASLVLNHLESLVTFHVPSDTPYTVTRLDNPSRLVFDLEGIRLPERATDLFEGGPGPLIKSIRTSQFGPSTARIVLDLVEAAVAVRVSPEGAPLTFKIAPGIERIGLAPTGDGDAIVVQGMQPLAPQIFTLSSPHRLVIDLPGTVLSRPLKELVMLDGPVRRLRAAQFEPDTVRVVAELAENMGWELRASSDKHTVVIVLSHYSLAGRRIVLDPGHGGYDPGTGRVERDVAWAVDATDEKSIVLDVGLRVKQLLDAAGADVTLTRDGDYYVSLYQRPEIAHEVHAHAFVSIHANAAPNLQAMGTETHFLDSLPRNRILADSIQSELVSMLQSVDRGLKQSNFLVLRQSRVPAVLVEIGFMSNRQEGRLLAQAWYRQRAAEGIFNGLLRYFSLTTSESLELKREPGDLNRLVFLSPHEGDEDLDVLGVQTASHDE